MPTKKEETKKNLSSVAKKGEGGEEKKTQDKYFNSVGRRKRAISTVRIYEKGKGKILINEKPLKEYFQREELQNAVTKPLKISGLQDKHDVTIHVKGGGLKGQADSITLSIARALIKIDESLRDTLKKNGFLKRDPRKKERKKPGLKRARRAPQWSKR